MGGGGAAHSGFNGSLTTRRKTRSWGRVGSLRRPEGKWEGYTIKIQHTHAWNSQRRNMCLFLEIWGLAKSSAVKGACCSFRGPRVSSQSPHQAAYNLLKLQGSLWSPQAHDTHMHTWMLSVCLSPPPPLSHTHTFFKKIFSKLTLNFCFTLEF